jgi:hypothetical protein
MKRKLRLHRETVRQLESSDLGEVQGGASRGQTCTFYTCGGISACYPCYTIDGPDCPYTQGCWTK